jgi:hypothetical protein
MGVNGNVDEGDYQRTCENTNFSQVAMCRITRQRYKPRLSAAFSRNAPARRTYRSSDFVVL